MLGCLLASRTQGQLPALGSQGVICLGDVFIAYRNLVRRRFNKEAVSPAEVAGWLPRRLRPQEVLSWRQDHGPLSIHPLAREGEAVVRWGRLSA